MDQVYIDALVNQALGAYKVGGDAGLEHWKNGLPTRNRKEFEEHCAKPLQKAIATLQAGWAEQTKAVDPGPKPPPIPKPPAPKPMELGNPRKKHTRDRRRTKPL